MEFGDVWKIIEHTAGQSQKLERQNREIKNFLSTSIQQAIAEERDRVKEIILQNSKEEYIGSVSFLTVNTDKLMFALQDKPLTK